MLCAAEINLTFAQLMKTLALKINECDIKVMLIIWQILDKVYTNANAFLFKSVLMSVGCQHNLTAITLSLKLVYGCLWFLI